MSAETMISFIGDISLNDNYIKMFQEGDDPFTGTASYLKESDFVVGNLECLASGDGSENELKKPRLSTTPDTLNYLKSIPVNMVSLAHNHVYDNLQNGVINTIEFLKKNKIQYIGADLHADGSRGPFFVEIKGIKLCFLNYVTRDTNPKIPERSNVYVNWYARDRICDDIKKYKPECDHLILLFHWGGRHEGGLYPDWYQMKDAPLFINSGADLIVGHHSHTLQPYEVYKGKYIFYSLGNFCFSNINKFNYEVDKINGVESVIVNVTFKKDSYNVNSMPIRNAGGYIIMDQNVVGKWNKRLNVFKILKSNKILWGFYHLKHKYIHPVLYYFFGNNRKFLVQLKKIKLEKIICYFTR